MDNDTIEKKLKQHSELDNTRFGDLSQRMDTLVTKEDLELFSMKLDERLTLQDKAIAPVIQALSTASGVRTFLIFIAPIAIIATIISWFKT
jgi:hypothetical protein